MNRIRGVGNFLGLSQELEHPLGRGHRLLENIGDIGELRDRLRKRADKLDNGLDIPNREDALDGQGTAQDTDGDIAQVADEIHDGEQQTSQELRFPGRVVEGSIDLVKLLNTLGLTVEGFHHDVPAIHFFDVTVNVTPVILLPLEEDLRLTDDQGNDAERYRKDSQSHQGHLPTDGEHHHEHTDDHGHGGNDLRQALVKRLADRVHIIGDARKYLAVAGAVKVFERQAVD